MDPNATLKEIRELSNKSSSLKDWDQDMERLQELCQALDGWISAGGFLPSEWKELWCPHCNKKL